MRTNGFICLPNIKAAATIDDNGEPIIANDVPEMGQRIPCSIKTITHHKKGSYEDGTFTVSKYEILIELCEFEADRISLEKQGQSKPLGEFAIQDIQVLSSVGRIKIIV